MGGHRSDLFSGTSGENLPDRLLERIKEGPGALMPYAATSQLKEHMTKAEYGGRKTGITGGHEKGAFEAKAAELGISIDSRTPNAYVDGVERVEYRLPKRDKTGEPTGEFQSDVKSKTIYDSKIISTDKYIERGMQAANEAASRSASGRLGHRWSGIDNEGVTWIGYTGSDGNVSTFYPDE